MCVFEKMVAQRRETAELGFLLCTFSFSIMVCGRVQHTSVKNERATETRRSAVRRKEQQKYVGCFPRAR